MYRLPPDRVWWPAIGSTLKRGAGPDFSRAAGRQPLGWARFH